MGVDDVLIGNDVRVGECMQDSKSVYVDGGMWMGMVMCLGEEKKKKRKKKILVRIRVIYLDRLSENLEGVTEMVVVIIMIGRNVMGNSCPTLALSQILLSNAESLSVVVRE